MNIVNLKSKNLKNSYTCIENNNPRTWNRHVDKCM